MWQDIVKHVLQPPPMPDLKLPWLGRQVVGDIHSTLENAWNACYFQGMLNGFLLCAVVVLLFYKPTVVQLPKDNPYGPPVRK
jgi:hypothetical protein